MSTSLTDEDRGFIRAILDYPEDFTSWLAYADWLEERADPRAEFLRLMVDRRELKPDDPLASGVEERLNVLRATLDPAWMLVFDDPQLRNCRGGGWRYRCPLSWAQLSPTDQPDIRICHECRSPVFFCHTYEEARTYASCGQCVALSSRALSPAERQQESTRFVTLGRLAPVERVGVQSSERPDSREVRPARRPWWKFW
jgi:uncharacterized protein (TIGR02996 family)